MLADASGLIALLDRSEPEHERCVQIVQERGGPMFTTWPSLTEAMYLLHRQAGWKGVESLWTLVLMGYAPIVSQSLADAKRMHELMDGYRDLPMALTDASLVVLAEARQETSILTLDSHFQAYVATWSRKKHGFEVLP